MGFKWKMENGERRMENGEWRMEKGERRMENGEWRMENGEWRMDVCANPIFWNLKSYSNNGVPQLLKSKASH
jgi:hypothetical protein